GSKRLCLDTDYYATYNRANVALGDVRAEPIEAATAAGLRTGAADYPVDIIVFAPGFDALTGALQAIDIRRRSGRRQREHWVPAQPLDAAAAAGLRTRAADYPVDIIVFATGFDALTGALQAIDIRGRSGRRLREDWGAGPCTYLGLGVPGYPNLFTITGPGRP